MSGPAELEIAFDNRSGFDIDSDRVSASAIDLLIRLGYDFGELGISYLTAEDMAFLNLTHMGKDGPTDVLSFPLDADRISLEPEVREAVARSAEGVPLLLGDVVICPEIAAGQAEAAGTSLEQELCLLLVHGILHIAGYDHETDAGEMERLQGQILQDICGSWM